MLYRHRSGQERTVSGVFDEKPQTTMPDGSVGLISTRPLLLLKRSELAEDPLGGEDGDIVDIGPNTYRVVDVAPDGQGGVLLTLEKA